MAHNSHHGHGAPSFTIFDDGASLIQHEHLPTAAAGQSELLRKLSHSQNQGLVKPANDFAVCPTLPASPVGDSGLPENKSIRSQNSKRTSRVRRPQIDVETFELLGAVPEETSGFVDTDQNLIDISPAANRGEEKDSPIKLNVDLYPFDGLESRSVLEEEIEKHLAGQFEWIMTYPAGANAHTTSGSQDDDHQPGNESGSTRFGCNLLPVRRRRTSEASSEGKTADIYTLLATPLDKISYPSGWNPNILKAMDNVVPVGLPENPPPPYLETPLKVSEVVTMVEQAISPSTSAVDERTPSLVTGSSRSGSFSIPRIEDSLEELDKLEEQLEAVHDLTRPHGPANADVKSCQTKAAIPPDVKGVKSSATTASKRASISGYSATVRVKPSQKERPSLRRSASLTLREKRQSQQESSENNKHEAGISRGQQNINRLSTPKNAIKSTKPPTVAKFELPGEAVARRLKEQREARQAQQQAEARKGTVSTPKARVNKLLPKPTFELPGEAISRRKREEREAKLRAEEEEQRKRREFKARPVRHSIGPATLPRETLTSRTRQSRGSPEANGEDDAQAIQQKRMSVGVVRAGTVSPPMGNSPRARGRNSTITSTTAAVDGESRETSTSIGSASSKRNSVSWEELHVQKQRGKDILARDNCYKQDREKGKRDREMAAKTAREQAAERSRIASREWAENKRRKEMAAKEARAIQE